MTEKRIPYRLALAIVTRMNALSGALASLQAAQQVVDNQRMRLNDAAMLADVPLGKADLNIHIDDIEDDILVEWTEPEKAETEVVDEIEEDAIDAST